MTKKLLEKIVGEYYSTRPNLHVHNAPLCVFFFACSGSGKTTLRKLLVEELRATYVCNDEVRGLLSQNPQATELGIVVKDIVSRTVEKIFAETSNHLVVFDNNIIQYYMHADSYLNVAKAKARPVYIIGLEATEETLVKRIKTRGVNVAQILEELLGQLRDYDKAK